MTLIINNDDVAQGERGCTFGTVGCEINFAGLPTNFGNRPLNTVDPDFQRRGIATRLIHHSFDWFKNAGMSIAMVETGA